MKASFVSVIGLALLATADALRNCVIPPSHPPGTDASPQILSTFKRCHKNSRVVFMKNTEYFIEKPMNITGLDNVHISLQGNVVFSDKNITAWQESIFPLNFQSAGTWWVFEGKNIRVDGGGVVDGQGQVWWDAVAKDPRPITMVFDKTENLHVSDITVRQTPFWAFLVRDSENIVFTNMNVSSVTNSTYRTRNSDFFNAVTSRGVTIKDSVIVNGDDCVAMKRNASAVDIENLDCTGSHGISIGSLGQYAPDGEIDIVQDVLVKNVTCRNCQNGARVKTWPGGKGAVQNITFQDMQLINNENPIIITTHYCDNNQMDYCTGANDHSLTITDIIFKDISGSVSDDGNPIINLNCSSGTPCTDITLENINIEAANNTPANVCVYVDDSETGSYCPSS